MKDIQLTYAKEPFVVKDGKRFYIPVILTAICSCGNKVTNKLVYNNEDDMYLSYPTMNGNTEFNLFCSECELNHTVVLRLDLSVSLVE